MKLIGKKILQNEVRTVRNHTHLFVEAHGNIIIKKVHWKVPHCKVETHCNLRFFKDFTVF